MGKDKSRESRVYSYNGLSNAEKRRNPEFNLLIFITVFPTIILAEEIRNMYTENATSKKKLLLTETLHYTIIAISFSSRIKKDR